MIRALVGYSIAAFAVLQIIEPVMHGLHWPDEVLSCVVVALAVGFPVVVSLAWIFDVKAGRIERTAPGGQPARSIAVLPFVNLSSDREQEYFSVTPRADLELARKRLTDVRAR